MNMATSSLNPRGDLKLRISVGHKNLGKVTNKTVTWSALVKKMSDPLIDVQHTLPQYLKLSVDEQSKLKNVGFFVGGQCDDGVRRISTMHERYLVTLDIDACNSGHLFDLEAGFTDLSEFEFFCYSTRKHTASKPRLRIILPLAEPCDGEAYHALSRIMAEMFDVTMESVDPVSYRLTQLMYWPSVCKDADFYTFHNKGALANPQTILDNFGDWRDHTKLPRSERDESLYTGAGKKPEDPETKEGLVGAFCRVYDVPAAIAEFLPDIYVDPTDTPQGTRYTFAAGTTSLGAVVYDDGKFLFSNHMHDPAAGHSQNAFDLVRIHLYGDLDSSAKEGTSPMALPSTKAMVERFKDDGSIAKDLLDQNYSFASRVNDDEGAFESLDPAADGELDGDAGEDDGLTDWIDQLDINEKGIIKSTMHNLVLILMNDERFAGTVRRNLFNGRKVYIREIDFRQFGSAKLPVDDKVNGSDWTDGHTRFIKIMLESPRGKDKPGYGLKPSDRDLNDAIDHAADRQKFHPVRNYLESLTWDGKPRLRSVFVDYLGAEDTTYHREVCFLTLMGAVTRIFEPGHKFDCMPVLEGLQGTRKSTFVACLAKKQWFSEMGDINDKNRTIEAMSGNWILEFAELHQFGRTEINRIKDFLSTSTETTRLAFERNPRTYRRQCVFIGTTNDSEYLRDNTGNRRFWPVYCRVAEIDIGKLQRNVDQIWAEAVSVYRAMRVDQPFGDLPLYISDRDVLDQAVDMQASRKITSNEEILADQIETWLETAVPLHELSGRAASPDEGAFDGDTEVKLFTRTVTCSAEIYEKVLGLDRRKLAGDKNIQAQIGKAMQLVPGWEKSTKSKHYGDYGKQRVLYLRVEDADL